MASAVIAVVGTMASYAAGGAFATVAAAGLTGVTATVVGTVAGVVAGAIVGGAIAAAGAALMGEDVGDAFKSGAITGALAGGYGGFMKMTTAATAPAAAKSAKMETLTPSSESVDIAEGAKLVDSADVNVAGKTGDVAGMDKSGIVKAVNSTKGEQDLMANGGGTAGQATQETALKSSGEAGKGLLGKAGKWWGGLNDNTQGLLATSAMQLGGGMLTGRGEQKAAEETAKREEEQKNIDRAMTNQGPYNRSMTVPTVQALAAGRGSFDNRYYNQMTA